MKVLMSLIFNTFMLSKCRFSHYKHPTVKQSHGYNTMQISNQMFFTAMHCPGSLLKSGAKGFADCDELVFQTRDVALWKVKGKFVWSKF